MVEVLGSVEYLLYILFSPLTRFLSRYKKVISTGLRFLGLSLMVLMLTTSHKAFAGYNSLDQVPEDKLANVKAAWEVGIKNGVSEAALAGMLGNANSESGFDPFLQQSGGPAWGFFQMEADRQARLKSFLAEKGASSDPVKASAASMEFVINELKSDNMFLTYGLEGDPNGTGRYAGPQSWGGPYRYDVLQYVQGNGKKISASAEEFYKNTDVKKAAVEFMVSYERAHSSRSTLHLDQRLSMSTQIYEKFAGSVEGGSDSSEDGGTNGKRVISISNTVASWTPAEADIPNMPSEREWLEMSFGIASGESNYKDFVERINSEEVKEDFAVGSDNATSIAKWKDERRANLAESSVDYLRTGILLIAMLLLVAPSVLMTAYFSDLWMIGLDSPALRAVTFNKLAVDYDRTGGRGIWFADRKQNEHLKVKRMGAGDLFVWCAVFSIIGVMGVSGYLFTAFGGLWQFISDALGYF